MFSQRDRSDPARPSRDGERDDAVAALVLEVVGLRRQVAELLEERTRRPEVDQACGVLMHRYGMNAAAGRHTLQRWARVADLSLEDLASAVITLAVDDDRLPPLERGVAHTVSKLLRRELSPAPDRPLGARSLPRPP